MIGQTLSHYRIVREIGRGGMAVVFEAEDLKLRRRVALKLLDAELAAQPERRQRFSREARAVAALNHPNIVTIHSVEEAGGFSFITMEFIDGNCLSDLIPGDGFDYPDWLAVARPLIGAVAAAHRRGITHRDLKPENIMVDTSGRLKVLDFGLAKVVDGAGFAIGPTGIKTLTMTAFGSLLGTAAYMSPEQAEGHKVDPRSDIFSLGVILFEMATGSLPFRGDSYIALLSSVIRDPAPLLTQVKPQLDASVGRVIETCLAKKAGQRFDSAEELWEEIDRLPGEPSEILSAEGVRRSARRVRLRRARWSSARISAAQVYLRRNPRLVWLSLAAIGLSITALLFTVLQSGSRPFVTRRILPIAVEGSLSEAPSWSPDGQWIVYASNRDGQMDLWRKSLSTREAQQLTATEHTESDPAWSPDGLEIAYASDAEGGGLFIMRASGGGGEPLRITDFGARPSWSPDGGLIAFESYGRVYVVPLDRLEGREPRMLFRTDGFPQPMFSPDGGKLVFWHQTLQDIYVGSLDGELIDLDVLAPGEEVTGLDWSRDGETIILSKGTYGGGKDLWRVPIDAQTGRRRGDPVRLSATPFHDVDCSISPDGKRIAYSSLRIERQLWSIELDPGTGLARADVAPVRLTAEGQNSVYPALSSDGRLLAWTAQTYGRGSLYYMVLDGDERGVEKKLTPGDDLEVREVHAAFSYDGAIAYASIRGGSYELWHLASPGAPIQQVTDTDPGESDSGPTWHPDGRTLAFQSTREGGRDIWTVSAIGSGWGPAVRRTERDEISGRRPAWSPDGRYVAYRRSGESPDIWLLEVSSWTDMPFEENPADEFWTVWSGAFLYFTSNRGGVFNVWMRPIDGHAEASQVTFYRRGAPTGLPLANLYTKFAIAGNRLVVPLETRRGEVYVLETELEP